MTQKIKDWLGLKDRVEKPVDDEEVKNLKAEVKSEE